MIILLVIIYFLKSICFPKSMHYITILNSSVNYYSQLAILSEQICLSSGYSFKFIGQANVSEIRILYSTEPLGKMRIYTLGMMMLWKCPSFSLEKKRSGIHTRFASVRVRYFRRPVG